MALVMVPYARWAPAGRLGKLGLPCQERQETVSPILTRPPGDLGHPLKSLQESLCIVRLPHLWDVDVDHGSRSPGSLASGGRGEGPRGAGPVANIHVPKMGEADDAEAFL